MRSLEGRKLAEPVIRSVRDDELGVVLELWQLAGVTPPSVSDSIEGLTCLLHEPAALLLVATIDDQIVGFSDRRMGRMAGEHLSPRGDTQIPTDGDCATARGEDQQRAIR